LQNQFHGFDIFGGSHHVPPVLKKRQTNEKRLDGRDEFPVWGMQEKGSKGRSKQKGSSTLRAPAELSSSRF
jgi:hypothetical protein